MNVIGAILAGGASSRFGSDKAMALYRGRPLLEHALAALRGQCETCIIIGRQTTREACAPDWPKPGMGPLGGIAGALHYARGHGFDGVLTLPVDCITLAPDHFAMLDPAPACFAEQPVIGFWPTSALDALKTQLRSGGSHSVRTFANSIDARLVRGHAAITNINTLDALELLEAQEASPVKVPTGWIS